MSIQERCIPPSGLVSYIIDRCAHPTTLVVGGSSAQFIQQWHDDEVDDDEDERIDRTKTTLLEVAVARHVRVVFVSTVAHLRGFLAAFDPATSPIPPPPSQKTGTGKRTTSKLIIYNLLRLHRETSEWSAQGLGATAAVLDEAGHRTGMRVVVVEGRERREIQDGDNEGREEGDQDSPSPWRQRVPILSTSARRQLEKAGYPLRTERIRRVLERWFTFDDDNDDEEEEEEEEEEEKAEEVIEEKEAEEEAETTIPEEMAPPAEAESSPLSSPPSSPLSPSSPSSTPPPLPPPQQTRTFVKDSEDEDDDFSDDYWYPTA